jgi:CTP synthase
MKLREIGLSPDMILCRTDHRLTKDVRNKIGLFGNLNPDHVIEGSEVKSIYEVPLTLYNQNVSKIIMDRLQLTGKAEISYLKTFIKKFKEPLHNVNIAMCGKYTELPDAYKSVLESFIHSGVENNARVNVHWVSTEKIKNDSDAEKAFNNMDGILLLPGFGSRGSEGKITSCKYARENNIPFLGICLGLQCAVIEFARNVCGLKGANSTEFNKKTPYPVIDLMESQKAIKAKGGTMRLGAYKCNIKKGTKAFSAYRRKTISERHRHRWEVNNRFRDRLTKKGLIISGENSDLNLVEIVELEGHPWYVAGQFHPELKSRVSKAHPLFREFIKASVKHLNKKKK